MLTLRNICEDGDYLLGAFYVFSSAAGFFSAYKTAGQACFTGDTPVAVEHGQKCIDEIEIGDKVWAYNVETGETELKTVTKVYVHSVDEILHLYTDEGNIDTTTNHPFYVIGKGWVAAGDLAVGDEVGTTSIIPETVSATVAPWGDSPGGGIQYNLPHTIQWLIDNAYLKEVY